VTAAAGTLAVTTCLKTIVFFCSAVKEFKTAGSILAKASSEGAKTVKASAPFKVSTNPKSLTIETKVLKDPAPTATSTTSPRAALGSSASTGAGIITESMT